MLKLPYSLADFYRIRTQGYSYVDRTAHLRDLEQLGDALLFLRPRRFGKSLWLDTLRCYYDLRLADEHDRLFGGLAIGREPTPLAHRFFVMSWDFSEIGEQGGAIEIGRRLNDYLNSQIELFLQAHAGDLSKVELHSHATDTLRHALAAISTTPHKLYLLIDEYDNFINEVMVSDTDAYRSLVRAEGPVKTVFKSIKAAMRGKGLERIFLTGVSPVGLNDLSSGFNIARDVSRHPRLATLCGFTEAEVRHELLEPMVRAGNLAAERVEEALGLMHAWYNGYRFASDVEEAVLNPTNCIYLLQELQELGRYPEQLYDRNLAIDEARLAFLSRSPAGERLVSDLAETENAIEIVGIENQISVEDIVARSDDRRFIASLFFYLGLLTLESSPQRLQIPNLVVRKLYLERLLRMRLDRGEDRGRADELVLRFFQDGDLEPVLGFVESKLFPALSTRDSGHMREVALKTLLLALLFDDRRYSIVSEPELGHGYADLCLLRRQVPAASGLFNLLFELKFVPGKKLGLSTAELRALPATELRALKPVAAALAEGRSQLGRYRDAFATLWGAEEATRLRCHVVVAVGLERLVSG